MLDPAGRTALHHCAQSPDPTTLGIALKHAMRAELAHSDLEGLTAEGLVIAPDETVILLTFPLHRY